MGFFDVPAGPLLDTLCARAAEAVAIPPAEPLRIDRPDGSLDAIVSLWSGFRGVDEAALAEVDRVLAPDGRLLVVHDYGRDEVSVLRRPGRAPVPRRGAGARARSSGAAGSRSASSTASGRSARSRTPRRSSARPSGSAGRRRGPRCAAPGWPGTWPSTTAGAVASSPWRIPRSTRPPPEPAAHAANGSIARGAAARDPCYAPRAMSSRRVTTTPYDDEDRWRSSGTPSRGRSGPHLGPIRITPARVFLIVALFGGLGFLAYSIFFRDALQVPLMASGLRRRRASCSGSRRSCPSAPSSARAGRAATGRRSSPPCSAGSWRVGSLMCLAAAAIMSMIWSGTSSS